MMAPITLTPLTRPPESPEDEQHLQQAVDMMRAEIDRAPATTYEVEGWPLSADELESALNQGADLCNSHSQRLGRMRGPRRGPRYRVRSRPRASGEGRWLTVSLESPD